MSGLSVHRPSRALVDNHVGCRSYPQVFHRLSTSQFLTAGKSFDASETFEELFRFLPPPAAPEGAIFLVGGKKLLDGLDGDGDGVVQGAVGELVAVTPGGGHVGVDWSPGDDVPPVAGFGDVNFEGGDDVSVVVCEVHSGQSFFKHCGCFRGCVGGCGGCRLCAPPPFVFRGRGGCFTPPP